MNVIHVVSISGISCAGYLRLLFFSCDIYRRICGLQPRISPFQAGSIVTADTCSYMVRSERLADEVPVGSLLTVHTVKSKTTEWGDFFPNSDIEAKITELYCKLLTIPLL